MFSSRIYPTSTARELETLPGFIIDWRNFNNIIYVDDTVLMERKPQDLLDSLIKESDKKKKKEKD